jgi:hypothetical protein
MPSLYKFPATTPNLSGKSVTMRAKQGRVDVELIMASAAQATACINCYYAKIVTTINYLLLQCCLVKPPQKMVSDATTSCNHNTEHTAPTNTFLETRLAIE